MARRNGAQVLEDRCEDQGLGFGPGLGKACAQVSGHTGMARHAQIPASGGWADTASGNRSGFRTPAVRAEPGPQWQSACLEMGTRCPLCLHLPRNPAGAGEAEGFTHPGEEGHLPTASGPG